MARIGLLSDSHGRARTTRLGVQALLSAGADMLIHLGDVGTVEVLDALCIELPDTTQQIESHLVFGNTDWDRDSLTRYANDLDLHVDDPMGRITTPGGVLMFTHGDDESLLADALRQNPAYLCHGHTHRVRDTTVGNTRVLNPGALFRAATYSVGLLNTATQAFDVITVGE